MSNLLNAIPQTPTRQLPSLSPAALQKADKTAKEFEAVFISQMLGHMFDGVETDGAFGGGNAENIFRSLVIDEYGKMIAHNGGLGISNSVKSEIIAMQARKEEGLDIINE